MDKLPNPMAGSIWETQWATQKNRFSISGPFEYHRTTHRIYFGDTGCNILVGESDEGEFATRLVELANKQLDEADKAEKTQTYIEELEQHIDDLRKAFNKPSTIETGYYINGRWYYYENGEIHNAELDAIQKYGETAVKNEKVGIDWTHFEKTYNTGSVYWEADFESKIVSTDTFTHSLDGKVYDGEGNFVGYVGEVQASRCC